MAAPSTRDSIDRISGPAEMAWPGSGEPAKHPPFDRVSVLPSTSKPKKKRNRGGKNRKRSRRPSFAAPSDVAAELDGGGDQSASLRASAPHLSLYRLQTSNRSNESLESEALLDHRDQGPLSRRRQTFQRDGFARPSLPFARHRGSQASSQPVLNPASTGRSWLAKDLEHPISEDDDDNDHTPLLGSSSRNRSKTQLSRTNSSNYGTHGSLGRPRRPSRASTTSSRKARDIASRSRYQATVEEADEDYDVNNPPSVPASPRFGSLGDVMITQLSTSHCSRDRGRDAVISIDSDAMQNEGFPSPSPDAMRRRQTVADIAQRDVCYPVDAGLSEIGDEEVLSAIEGPTGPGRSRRSRRRKLEEFPKLFYLDEWAMIEKEERTQQEHIRLKRIAEPVLVGGRLRPGKSAWHREEDDTPFRFTYFNEMFDSTVHARNISDLLQDGVTFKELFKPEPMEFTDSEEDEGDEGDNDLQRHSLGPHGHQSLSGGTSPGQTNKEPSMHSMDAIAAGRGTQHNRSPSASGTTTPAGGEHSGTPRPHADQHHGHTKGNGGQSASPTRPTWWLDVLQPTEDELRVLGKAFGIHQLTIEDINISEEREKVELFQTYYFVNYRSFEQDTTSEDYMEPVNIYMVIFRDCVLTFHHTLTPHMNNVRRRVRQLYDYMSPTADWISYALIDDITDAYAPLVTQIEKEVDVIDDEILHMHQSSVDHAFDHAAGKKPKVSGAKRQLLKCFPLSLFFGRTDHSSDRLQPEKEPTNQADMGAIKSDGEQTAGETGGDMLRRVGESRRKVMVLYRLLGNKADVIKGFAKRCNEHWEVAPRGEIGLYLGDIQDHIVTMTGNLSHYEKYVPLNTFTLISHPTNGWLSLSLLSRAHSNYLAQINIRMNERAEQTADVLGKLTVLGTIVLPMNIITGMWGMNVWVPGQEIEDDLTWFWCITFGLVAFGCTSYFVAKKVYGIV